MLQVFYLFILLFVISFGTSSQKQDRIWVFSTSAGIDFNDLNNPVPISSRTGSYNSTNFASIANNQGELLLYCAAISPGTIALCIYNKTGGLIEDGDQLTGRVNRSQGSMILPLPGDTNQYIVFSLLGSLHYNVVDMSDNNGSGKVIARNIEAIHHNTFSQKMNATRHANGRDWWVVLASATIDQKFYKILVTPAGIQDTLVQYIGSGDNSNKLSGQMIFSEDGTKLVSASNNSSIDLFDFDRCTGELSNYRSIAENSPTIFCEYFGCSLSPNGNVLYTSSYASGYNYLYQFDLTASNINSTKRVVNSFPSNQWIYGEHLLAPDNKIYIVKSGQNNMDVILQPDSFGLSCNYQSSFFSLGSKTARYGLPTMVHYNLGPVVGSVCDSLIGIDDESINGSVQIYPNPFTKLITIQSTKSIDGLVKVYNEIGSIVLSKQIIGNQDLDLGFLSNGNYILEITGAMNVFRKKIVKAD